MKKLLAFILALVAVCSLCACGATEEYDDELNDADGNAEIEVEAPEATDPVVVDPTDPVAPADPVDPENAEPEINTPANPENSEPETVVPENNAPLDIQPTEEELLALENYRVAVKELTDYHTGVSDSVSWPSKNGYIQKTHSAEKPDYYVISSIYHAVADNTALVDKFKNTTFAQTFETNWDYEEVLSWITVIEDVRIGCDETVYDATGEVDYTIPREYVWYYDKNGNHLPVKMSNWYEIVSGLPVYNADIGRLSTQYTYTVVYENGEVKELRYMWEGEAKIVLTPTFGEYGIVSAHAVCSNGRQMDITYTYDENGRLTRIEAVGKYEYYENHYIYNDQGQLVKSWDEDNKTYEYTYDENGVLVSTLTYEVGNYVGAYGHQVITYTYDDQGRVLTASIAYKDATDEAKRVYEFVYGDFYVL